MSPPTTTEQVQYLILWAQRKARGTGVRQRVKGYRGTEGWYYQTSDTNLLFRVRKTR